MDLLHIAFLALVQGITEFLPISSSAHLILVPALTGWEDQGLAFDVAVHGGTLLAVLLYAAEDALHVVRTRLEGICQVAAVTLRDLPIHVITAPSLRLDLAEDRRRLQAVTAAEAGIDAYYAMLELPVTPWLGIVGGARFESTELGIVNMPESNATWLTGALDQI